MRAVRRARPLRWPTRTCSPCYLSSNNLVRNRTKLALSHSIKFFFFIPFLFFPFVCVCVFFPVRFRFLPPRDDVRCRRRRRWGGGSGRSFFSTGPVRIPLPSPIFSSGFFHVSIEPLLVTTTTITKQDYPPRNIYRRLPFGASGLRP